MSTSSTEGGNQGQESGTATQGTGQESTQGENGSQGQESGGQQQGQEQQAGEFSLDTITDPAVRAYVEAQQRQAQEARTEAARYRNERNTLQTAEEARQRAAETDQQRADRESQERQERLDTLERENRALKVGGAIRDAAEGAKAHNPVLVASMLDSKVTLDDQGKPSNLQDLLKDLRKSDPYLFKRTDNNGGEGTGDESQPTGNMNDAIRSAFRARQGRSTS